MLIPDMFDATTLIIAFIAFILAKLLLHKRRNNLPPGPRPWPLLGNVKYQWRRTGFTDSRELVAEYGPLYTIYFGRTPIVALASTELMQEAFCKNGLKFADRPNDLFTMRISRKGEHDMGILFANGEVWDAERRLVVHSMKSMGAERRKLEESVHEELKYLIHEIENKKQTPFDPDNILQIAVSNIISTIIFGSRFDNDDATLQKLLKIIQFPSQTKLRLDIFTPLNFNPILQVLFYIGRNFITAGKTFGEHMKDFVDEVTDRIKDHRRTYDPGHMRDFLDIYIKSTDDSEDQTKLSESQVMRTIFDLYFAGTDTTAQTLRWILLYMINYPDVQEKCAQEIAEVAGDRPLTTEDEDKLPYVRATISEVIRMSSVARGTIPHRTTCDVKLSGYDIPKGTIVMANLEQCHRDPRYWVEPESFRPDHFLDQDGNYKGNKSFVPFSMGRRMCLGDSMAKTELFLYFATLVQKFEFKKESPDVRLCFDPVLVFTFHPKKYKLVCFPRK